MDYNMIDEESQKGGGKGGRTEGEDASFPSSSSLLLLVFCIEISLLFFSYYCSLELHPPCAVRVGRHDPRERWEWSDAVYSNVESTCV